MNSTPTVPTPTVATTSTQTHVVTSAAASTPVTVYNLAKGKFDGVPCPTEILQAEENPSIHNFNHPQSEAIPQPSKSEKTPPALTPYQPP